MKILHIVALGPGNEIGKEGNLPYRLKGDLPRFKALTSGKVVIMGRKTSESLPNGYLPNRTNIIITRQNSLEMKGGQVLDTPGELVDVSQTQRSTRAALVNSVEAALELAESLNEPEVYVIGGGEIYSQTMDKAHMIRATHAFEEAPEDCDAFYPEIDPKKWAVCYEQKAPAGTHRYTDYCRIWG